MQDVELIVDDILGVISNKPFTIEQVLDDLYSGDVRTRAQLHVETIKELLLKYELVSEKSTKLIITERGAKAAIAETTRRNSALIEGQRAEVRKRLHDKSN